MKKFISIACAALLFSGCATTGYKPVTDPLPSLKLSFVDAVWDSKQLPSGQQCSMFGGQGATPRIKVENIPAGANAVIVEYNDLDFGPLSYNGGHGTIGQWTEGATTVTLTAVPGDKAKDLPSGTFVEAPARSTGSYASLGYLPPCSGGRGHTYVADVKAVYKGKQGEENRLLAQQRIVLGKY